MNDEHLVLSRVSIRNFKSIREADLELRPLTVLVGENSAGKSSVLQLLFLLSQNARGRSRPDVVSLNGMELNLGNFGDVLHSASPGEQIEIALVAPVAHTAMRRRLRIRQVREGRSGSLPEGLDEGEWRLALDEPVEQLGVARIAMIEIADRAGGARLHIEPNLDAAESESLYEHSRSLGLVRSTPVSRARLVAAGIGATRFQGYLETTGGDGAEEESEILPAVAVDSGVPVELFALTNEALALAKRWIDASSRRAVESRETGREQWLRNLRRERRVSQGEKADPASVAQELFPAFYRWVESVDRSERRAGWNDIEAFEEETLVATAGISDDIGIALADLLEARRSERGAIAPRSSPALDLADGIRSVLHDSVHYLGPLREDPSVSYPPGQSGGVATLGVKGEFTVAALEMYRAQTISCPLPGGGEARLPLGEAVNRWATAFGLASQVRTEDKGRLGIELELIDPQTGASRDLTSVGVGVSQLLPVIVICLLAQPGEIVLLEQPELHLHPAPQQILGDFLLAVSDSGRQVIVETHSEYLINRLRLRIAEDEYGTVNEAVQLLYAQRQDGETQFEPMRPNRYGSFEDWPEGFFDQAPRESEAILRAAVRKRRSSSKADPSSGASAPAIPVHVEYQGTRVEALFEPESETLRIVSAPLDGQSYGSPSGAAIAVVRELNPSVSPNRNGWDFWRVSATGEPLASIRE